jgi:acetyl-CoA carboxylase biotin carboxyl carrier protein
MTIEEIKELLLLFNESGVGELELQRGENRLRIRRQGMDREYVVTPMAGASAGAPHAGGHGGHVGSAPVAASAGLSGGGMSAASAPATARVVEADAGHILVKSPIVGTYYDAPAPGSAPFVKVGDAVEPGQVLCIIESMKLMNEIEAEVAGVVAAKLVENGRPVEYGEALLAVRPR